MMNSIKFEILIKLKTFILFLDNYAWFLKIRITKYAKHLIVKAKVKERTYKNIILDSDYQEKKACLIEGLDDKSVKVVNLTIKRIRNFLKKKRIFHSQRLDEFIELKKANIYKIFMARPFKNNYKIGKTILPRKYYDSQIFWDKYFLDEFENLDLIKEKNIVDVGAFIGDSSILFQEYTNHKVFAFEPVEKNYLDLLKTIELNKADKIIPYKLALGSNETKAYINKIESSCVSATLRKDVENRKSNIQEEIEIRRLDEIVQENNLQIGLIKVDIEGFEQDFLEGALETIKMQKPALLIAIYHTGEDFFNIKPWIDSLNLGYKFKIRKAAKSKVLDDIILICEVR